MSNKPATYYWKQDGYLISTEHDLLDFELVHSFLSQNAAWRKNISFSELKSNLSDSLCFGLYLDKVQLGFASVTTDYTSFAYLTDVFVLESHRGHGLAKWLIETIMKHPGLQGDIDWMLSSEDAQGLYEKVGFSKTEDGGGQMEKLFSKT